VRALTPWQETRTRRASRRFRIVLIAAGAGFGYLIGGTFMAIWLAVSAFFAGLVSHYVALRFVRRYPPAEPPSRAGR
jgi:hypothetical protein